jgi:hypothetical protein
MPFSFCGFQEKEFFQQPRLFSSTEIRSAMLIVMIPIGVSFGYDVGDVGA